MANLAYNVVTAVHKHMQKMEQVKFPEFLNTKEKYEKCVRNIRTVTQFEEVFNTLLDDDDLTLSNVMKIMTQIERDVILIHGNKDISCVLDMAEAIINYQLINSMQGKREREKDTDEDEVTSKKVKTTENNDIKILENAGKAASERRTAVKKKSTTLKRGTHVSKVGKENQVQGATSSESCDCENGHAQETVTDGEVINVCDCTECMSDEGKEKN